jgi:hypothetical protein
VSRKHSPDHWCTDARRDVLLRDWGAGVGIGTIRKALAALTGATVPPERGVTAYATTVLRLRRPEGYRSTVKLAFYAERRRGAA